MVELGRQWYAVCRVLEDVNVVPEGDFEGFCQRVRAEVPAHNSLPTRIELQRMAVQSFKKPVSMWNELNAPVQDCPFLPGSCETKEVPEQHLLSLIRKVICDTVTGK